MEQKNNAFIVLEGIDGSGKTTQLRLLSERLEAEGIKTSISAEPTKGNMGREIRRVLSGEIKASHPSLAAMYVIDRINHNVDIEEQLNEGITVLSDRYYYSSLAYQGVTCDYAWVKKMNLDCPYIRRPDLCIFLDLTPEESLKRISARYPESEREIFETSEMLSATRNRFFDVFADIKDRDNIVVIDASKDRDTIADEVYNEVKKYLECKQA